MQSSLRLLPLLEVIILIVIRLDCPCHSAHTYEVSCCSSSGKNGRKGHNSGQSGELGMINMHQVHAHVRQGYTIKTQTSCCAKLYALHLRSRCNELHHPTCKMHIHVEAGRQRRQVE